MAILVWLTILLEQGPIQKDLSERTGAALKEAGFGWAAPEFEGRDGLVRGRALGEEQPDKVAEIARGVWGVRVVGQDIDLVDLVKDYFVSAALDGGKLTLSGYAPGENERGKILALAKERFPAAEIEDRMSIARGAPETAPWISGIGFGLDRLAQLNGGEVKLAHLGLSLGGEAGSLSAYRSVKGALAKSMPKGVTLVADEVKPPVVSPYVWQAKRTAAQLVLSGHVPSEALREQVFTFAKSKFPNLVIIDRMEPAGGADEQWGPAVLGVLGQLAELRSGEADMSDRSITVRGEAADQQSAARITEALAAGAPDRFQTTAELTYPEPKPPAISPYVTNVTASAEDVVVSGYVPSEDVRTAVLGKVAADFPDRKLVDQLELGSGAPETWRTCLDAGLSGLKRVGAGRLALTDRSLLLEGRTMDEAVADALPAEVRAAANRACETSVNVLLDVPPEPNLTWRAINSGDGEIVLEGEVPDRETEAMLLQAAEQRFSGSRIVNRMTVAGGSSAKWQRVASAGLLMLSRLRSGEAVLNGQELFLRGAASDTAVATSVKDQLKHALPKGYQGQEAIEVRSDAMIWAEEEARRKAQEEARRQAAAEAGARRQSEAEAEAQRQAETEARRQADAEAEAKRQAEEEARRQAEAEAEAKRRAEEEARRLEEIEARAKRQAEEDASQQAATQVDAERAERVEKANACQELLRSAAAAGKITFRFASHTLDPESHPTLNKLAQIASQCPEFRISIEGHTDAEGAPERNQLLSERRAQSVVDYLKLAGVDGDRLSAAGFGETRPIAPNDTPTNRARNRRIEFSVRVD